MEKVVCFKQKCTFYFDLKFAHRKILIRLSDLLILGDSTEPGATREPIL